MSGKAHCLGYSRRMLRLKKRKTKAGLLISELPTGVSCMYAQYPESEFFKVYKSTRHLIIPVAERV